MNLVLVCLVYSICTVHRDFQLLSSFKHFLNNDIFKTTVPSAVWEKYLNGVSVPIMQCATTTEAREWLRGLLGVSHILKRTAGQHVWCQFRA